ncbi:putative transcription factor interactor and regulator CCHC(Zn) family [Helianthus annuus]|nr:putative transcription factor interactor and regulator CCHC(Zn) family [Helianthus annuus]
MDQIYSNTSAVHNSDMQESGMRASYARSDNLRPTSSMMPCAHCSEEKRERRRMEHCCYYCNMPGHQISSCQEKEKDEENNHQIDRRLEFIVDGTEGGCWSDIWYVSKSLKHHFSSNIDMFKRIKNVGYRPLTTHTTNSRIYVLCM